MYVTKGHIISLLYFAISSSFSLHLFANNSVFMSSSGEIENTNTNGDVYSFMSRFELTFNHFGKLKSR